MLRTIGLLVTALALVGAAVALASTTKLEQWAAFTNGKLADGIHVVRIARGSCSGGSRVDARSAAWNCVTQGHAEDPCFAAAAVAFVICPFGTPDSHDALKLNLTRPLPAGKANPPVEPTRHDPWAVLMANGAYCYRATGTPSHIAGKTITYQCAGAALLAGHPNRTQTAWMISLLPSGTSTRYRTVAIANAWW